MSDSIAIMRAGKIVQIGSARTLYDAPVNRYVADFVGESNFFDGQVSSVDASDALIVTGEGLTLGAPQSSSAPVLTVGSKAIVAVRPEVISMWGDGMQRPGEITFDAQGIVTNRIYLGDQTEYRVVTRALGEVLVRTSKSIEAVTGIFNTGDSVSVGWRQDMGLALADD